MIQTREGAAMREGTADVVVELLEHFSRKVQTVSFSAGLNPAQWSALRFLATANRTARTSSALADHLTVRRATASQTLKSLVEKGYVNLTPSESDGRVRFLDLTDSGRAILAQDPLRPLMRALQGVEGSRLAPFVDVLEACIRTLYGDSGALAGLRHSDGLDAADGSEPRLQSEGGLDLAGASIGAATDGRGLASTDLGRSTRRRA